MAIRREGPSVTTSSWRKGLMCHVCLEKVPFLIVGSDGKGRCDDCAPKKSVLIERVRDAGS